VLSDREIEIQPRRWVAPGGGVASIDSGHRAVYRYMTYMTVLGRGVSTLRDVSVLARLWGNSAIGVTSVSVSPGRFVRWPVCTCAYMTLRHCKLI